MDQAEEMNIFNTLRDEFNRRGQNDPNFLNQVSKFNRTLQITVTDNDNTYHFSIRNGQADDLKNGAAPKPDISLSSPMKKIMAILVGQLTPSRIVFEKDIRIRGTPGDLAFINKFLLKESPEIRRIAKTIQL